MTNRQDVLSIDNLNIWLKLHRILFNRKILSVYIYFSFVLASILITGYYIYKDNQAIQIPLIHLLNDSSLYPNDPFVATLPYYSSILWYGVAFASHYIPLEPLLFTLFLIERLLVIYAARNLARVMAPNSQLAAVGAMALFALGIQPILGSGTIVVNYFEQTAFAIPFFLLAIAAFYQDRSLYCAIFLAIGFNLNSMYGTYALTYLGAIFLVERNYRQAWQKWLTAFGLFLLLASPAILLTLSAFSRKSSNQELWLAACQIFFPQHFYPHVWKRGDISKFIVLISLVVALLYQNRQKLDKLFKYVTTWACVSLLWLLYAIVAAYIAKSPPMLVMHPARGTDLWYCIAGIALVSICATSIEESRSSKSRAMYVAAFSASILIWHPLFEPYSLAVGLMILLWKPIRYYIFSRNSSSHLSLLLTLWVLFIGMEHFKVKLNKTGNIEKALISRPSQQVEQIVNWAKINTSKDSLFFIQPDWIDDWHLFRALAKRPVFLNWQDGSAILWDRKFANIWADRLQILGLDITKEGLNHWQARAELRNIYDNLQDEDLQRLKPRFSLDYWVTPITHISKFPVIFENQSYKVLDLNR